MEESVTINQTLPTWVMILIIVLVIIEVILKGVALYRAGENQSKGWFIFMFLINSAGILPIIYLLSHKNPAKQDQ